VGGLTEDCWTPGMGPTILCSEVITDLQAGDEVLEVKPGDDHLGHHLTLDEHLRRGGTYDTWSQPSLREAA